MRQGSLCGSVQRSGIRQQRCWRLIFVKRDKHIRNIDCCGGGGTAGSKKQQRFERIDGHLLRLDPGATLSHKTSTIKAPTLSDCYPLDWLYRQRQMA
ncbi:hypothetical protein MAXJ12_26408 [Mesorhizobium alhagi CCNWXJ12-2]|uniref:Uncharacterized protein n=1 Tax=Mesorhizobium alhagi CCNWXJ12-2 TaxID=1107882 RepID=H0HYK1_9HYPH|nr:hypothetical protein MAXJ12_26408 [Mesorhizobium alhagi CCNWXJ12-2]